MRRLAVLPLLAGGAVFAEDAAPAPAAARPQGWTYHGKLGLWFQNISSSNAETSRDATIAQTTDTVSFTLGGEGNAIWRRGINEVEQNLKAKYGRQRQAPAYEWTTSADELRYDGIFRTIWSDPLFTYLGWGTESSFVGPLPDREPFGQGRAWVTTGCGLKGERLLLADDKGELRFGVKAQQKWGDNYSAREKQLETGPDWFARYEAKLKTDIKGYLQYEGSSEFIDPRHVTNLLTAGLFIQIAKYLTVDIAYRAYYESRPDHATPDETGYGSWSMRSETLLGAIYTF